MNDYWNTEQKRNSRDIDDIIHKIKSKEKEIELLTVRINEPLNEANNDSKKISKEEYNLMNIYSGLKEFLEFSMKAELERTQHDISNLMLQQAMINEKLNRIEKELDIIKKKQL